MSERAESPDRTTPSDDPTTSLRHYVAPLRDHRKVVLLVTLVTVAIGFLVAVVGPRSYTATTSVVIYPVSADPTEALQGADRSDDLATELRIADSRAVAEVTASELQALGIDVTAEAAADAVTVTNPEDSRVLNVSYRSSDPAVARVGSELATSAYLSFRSELNAASRGVARSTITDEIAVLQDRLAEVEQRIDQAAAGSSARLVAEVEKTSIEGGLAAQQDALADLSTLTIDAATVFDEAREPSAADGPGAATLLVGALAGGLVLGVIAAWILAALGLEVDGQRTERLKHQATRLRRPDADDEPADADSPFDDSDTRNPLELLEALDAIEPDPRIGAVETPTAEEESSEDEPPSFAELSPSDLFDADGQAAAIIDGLVGPDRAEEAVDDGSLPVDHVDPSAAPAPLEAAEPVEPVEPVLAAEPFEMAEPVEIPEPLEPAEPIEATEPVEPIDDAEPFEVAEPVEVPEPVEPIEATEPVEPEAEPIEATEPVEPIEEAEPVEATGPEAVEPPATLRGLAAFEGLPGHELLPPLVAPAPPAPADEPTDSLDDDGAGSVVAQEEPTEEPVEQPITGSLLADLPTGAVDRSEDQMVDPFDDEAADPSDEEEIEASLTSGDPRELDPGPPSWDGPFIGPTTWDQLSAMAAADADAPQPAEAPDEEPTPVEEGAVEEGAVAEVPVEEPPAPAVADATAALVAANDVDALFEKLGRLGSAGPVSILSLSDRNPAAGLTAGFELADELRALGARVLLIDARLEAPVLDTLFEDGPGAGLAQVMTGQVVLADAVRTLPGLEGLDLLTVGTTDGDSAAHLTGAPFWRLLAEARLTYHSIVVIGDAVTGSGGAEPIAVERAGALATAVDGLIVGTTDPVGTTASGELTGILASLEAPTLQLIAAPMVPTDETVPEASSV